MRLWPKQSVYSFPKPLALHSFWPLRMFALFSVGQSLKGDAGMARRAPTVPYLSSFNYLQPVLAQRPHLERGAGRAFAGQ